MVAASLAIPPRNVALEPLGGHRSCPYVSNHTLSINKKRGWGRSYCVFPAYAAVKVHDKRVC